MRVVCWNLRGGTDAKWDLLRGLRPDVAVLPEAARRPRRLEPSLLEAAPSWHWVGRNPAKGLAVATFGAESGTLAPDATGRWSVAARQGSLTVLGIWSCPTGGQYALEVERALDAHARWLDPDGELVVAGDFNVAGRGTAPPSAATARLFARLGRLGLTSAYHTVWHEAPGAESTATYFHHRDPERPFHIDFCFVSASLRRRLAGVEVGSFEDWVRPGHSDHCPLVVEFDPAPARRARTAPAAPAAPPEPAEPAAPAALAGGHERHDGLSPGTGGR